MTAPAARRPKRPAQYSNLELRRAALSAAKRLRARDPEAPFGAEALAWTAELVQTLANRLPQAKVAASSRRRP